ncbi:protein SCAI isoform X1 [Anticarsia gemmatalis]
MGNMGEISEQERKITLEFCHLLEKSKQLFNGLRELPQYGHKQWHSYFGRTFDVYTKLWKFQQQHRGILDTRYGLKRWQIGEIASKIGQLYYHFYLRTSETAYLNEAFSFYFAIRGRSYYTKASKEDRCELMVKKLRYYARFIVVCLLLRKLKLVRELIKELDRQIIEYGNTYDPDDQLEWTVVVDEVKAFIQAEPVLTVMHPDNYPVILTHRLNPQITPPVERNPMMTLSLQEVVIVGSTSHQVKFSELTMDMFRMLQTLEREPTGDVQQLFDDSPRQKFNTTPSALNNKGYNVDNGPRNENPHKFLLFKPTPAQIMVYLSNAMNDLPPHGVMLLYISADGHIVPTSKHVEDLAYDSGGLLTVSKNDVYREPCKDPKAGLPKLKECLYPGDLYPYTRRPFFVIIESDNSYGFQNIPRYFGQPAVILMSPVELPTSLHDIQVLSAPYKPSTSGADRRQGGLFTLFLHSPLSAFCYICDIHTLSLSQWERAQSYIDAFMAESSALFLRCRVDGSYITFMGDDFLRLTMVRYNFCEMVMKMHRAFRIRTQLPRASPPLPEELVEHPALVHIIMDLATHLQVRGHFIDPTTAGPPPAKE